MIKVETRSPQIQGARRWAQEIVAGQALCPPLVHTMRKFTHGKTVDWDKYGKKVEIVSYFRNNPDTALADAVSKAYYEYVRKGVDGNGSSVKMFIMPDFSSNGHFDAFAMQILGRTTQRLSTEEGRKLVQKVMRRSASLAGASQAALDGILNNHRDSMANIFAGAFNIGYFYGQDLDQDDLLGLDSDRGSLGRQKILSRAPYYIYQVANSIRNKSEDGQLNRVKLRIRNTLFAYAQDSKEWGKRMDSYRRDTME